MDKISKNNGIYDYDKRIARTLDLINKELSQQNIKIITQYHKIMIIESLSKALQNKHLQTILSLTRFLGKDWTNVTQSDLDDVVSKIVQKHSPNGQETNTTHDHKKILKIFYRWFKLGSRSKLEVGDPPETKHIRIKRVKDKIAREDLLTESDLAELFDACRGNTRDKALISCLYDAGTRPGEILYLQIKHVKFDDNGIVLQVDGKTGARPVRLIESIPHLSAWLNSHPFRNNPESPLWVNLGNINYGQQLSYSSARQMIKRRGEIANLSKRIYLNLFRHTEATRSAKFMTEAHLKKRHGWTPDSKMPGRYTHLNSIDVDDALFKHYGIKKENEKIPHLPQTCPVCQTLNEHSANICSKCSKPLNLGAIEKIEEDQNLKIRKFAKKLVSDEIDEWKEKYFELQKEMVLQRSDITLANAMNGIPTVVDLKELESQETSRKPEKLSWMPVLP